MSGDYSRKTFDPKKHFSGVLMQQGRVQLDADWNEQVGITDRRWRAETVDVVGRCGVPEETPDGFAIEIAGGALTIGRGRMYVDGHLAENHGQPPLSFATTLAEELGSATIAFDDQPYVIDPDTTPTPAGQALVYLDVWQREITYLEDPQLVEIAVDVDTTTRHQTVWQAKILPDVGATVTCATADADIPGWLDTIAPSAGRLTTEAVGVPTVTDPCRVPPTGGFRGVDNRNYLLEIHDPGPTGTATFKWSRVHGTVATNVTAIPAPDTLRVVRTARDPVLRFNEGDWVEILDDRHLLGGIPGEMRRVQTIDDATRTITLSSGLPMADFPTDPDGLTEPERHTVVRRWDQSGVVRDTGDTLIVDLNNLASGGVIPVPAPGTSIILEDGVQVTFDMEPLAGDVHTADSWSFAARTANASVEQLDTAPPCAIHHHYCRLALVESDGTAFIGDVIDCRAVFPPLTAIQPGCCTVVVRPGKNIQAALDSLPPEGGCVCLKTGLHEIDAALEIRGSNVVLEGESPGVIVRRSDEATLLQIGNPAGALVFDVAVRNIRFEYANASGDGAFAPLLSCDGCGDVAVTECAIAAELLELRDGIRIARCDGVRVEHCSVENVGVGLWVAADSTALTVIDNTFDARLDNGEDGGAIGLFLDDAFGASRLERNLISGYLIGISLNRNAFGGTPTSNATGSVITANRIARSGVSAAPGDTKLFAIDIAAARCSIIDNDVTYSSHAYGGIGITGPNCRIAGNRIELFAEALVSQPAIGILLGLLDDAIDLPVEGGVIESNRISGPQTAVSLFRTSRASVIDNDIDSPTDQVGFAIALLESDAVRASGNRISNSALGIVINQGTGHCISDNRLRDGGAGLTIFLHTALEFSGNRLENMGLWGILGLQMLGRVAIHGNRFVSCGYEQPTAMGIGISQVFGELDVTSNEILNIGVSPDEGTVVQPAFGIFADLVLECRIQSNQITYSNPGLRDLDQEDRALWLRGSLELQAGNTLLGWSAQVLDNKFSGAGFTNLVQFEELGISPTVVRRFERVVFNNNFCWHWNSGSDDSRATLALRGRNAIVMGNHFKALTNFFAADFNAIPGVYIGNIAVGGTLQFVDFPNPETAFNRLA